MKCPDCSEEMIAGEATVRGTAIGFLAVGFSIQHLFFKQSAPENGAQSNKKKILPSGNVTMANHCDECGTTVLKKVKTVW